MSAQDTSAHPYCKELCAAVGELAKPLHASNQNSPTSSKKSKKQEQEQQALPDTTAATTGDPDAGYECSICLESSSDGDFLYKLIDCGHTFHIPCLVQWLELRTTCPLCRSVLQVPMELRYRGRYRIPNQSTNMRAMHVTLKNVIHKLSGAGLLSKYGRSVPGRFNCDAESITFSTKSGVHLRKEQPQGAIANLFRSGDAREGDDTIAITVKNMREIYCRGRFCLLAVRPSGKRTDEYCNENYHVYAFDAGDATRAASVFSKLRAVCEPHAYIRGVRYD